jgi:hypothetical protein
MQYPQGPCFPPQTFEIPDIEVSNSVFSVDAAWPPVTHKMTTHHPVVQHAPPTSPDSVDQDSSSGDDSISLNHHQVNTAVP